MNEYNFGVDSTQKILIVLIYKAVVFCTFEIFPASSSKDSPNIKDIRSKAFCQKIFAGKVLHAINSVIKLRPWLLFTDI